MKHPVSLLKENSGLVLATKYWWKNPEVVESIVTFQGAGQFDIFSPLLKILCISKLSHQETILPSAELGSFCLKSVLKMNPLLAD